MSVAYVPPGVTIQELTSPSVTPILAIPGSICLVGLSTGVITQTDRITLTGTTAAALPRVPAGSTMTSSSIVSILDATNPAIAPTGFTVATDFTFNSTNYTITRVVTSNTLSGAVIAGATTATLSSGPVPAVGQVIRFNGGGNTETQTVASVSGQVVTLVGSAGLVNGYSGGATVSWGNIPDGDSVNVTYTFTPGDYFQPIRLNSMADIQFRFGEAWDITGTSINSPLSHAAQIAFENGASNVVLQPLYFYNQNTGVRQQPTATQAALSSVWSTVFTGSGSPGQSGLQDLEDINILVPVVGQSQANVNDAVMLQIETDVQAFVYNMKHVNNIFVVGIVGEDSSASSSVAQEPALTAHAQILTAGFAGDVTQQMVFINTSQFSRANNTGSLLVGGQYVAAAVAGMLSARAPSAPITRQPVAGFLAVTDYRSRDMKNADASNGMLVVESKGNLVQVRHGITLDSSTVATRELNVVRAKHFVVISVQQTLERQVIGKIVADADAPTIVNNVVIATLEDIRGLGFITSYGNVESRVTTIDPTAMEVRFSYRPVFIVNIITVVFSLDIANQSVTVTSAGSTV